MDNKPQIQINFLGKEETLTQKEQALFFTIAFSSHMVQKSQNEKMKKYWTKKMEQARRLHTSQRCRK